MPLHWGGGSCPHVDIGFKFRWSHTHLFTVIEPLLNDRIRILMRFRNSGLLQFCAAFKKSIEAF
jgi:hypothetical protein